MLDIKNVQFSYAASKGHQSEGDQSEEGMSPESGAFHFDLSVNPGEIMVVEGRSGAGKSTLLNLVSGFLTPSSGQIFWQGRDITALPPQKRPLSMIFQDGNLFDHLSCRQNVALGMTPSLRLTQNQWQAVDKACDALGILSLKDRKPADISGGQQQRVALARALIRAEWQESPLLLFDEPFSALDTETRLDCIEAVKTLITSKSMTGLMVSHDPEDAKRLAARVYSI